MPGSASGHACPAGQEVGRTQSCSAYSHPLAHSPPRSLSPTGPRLSSPACSSPPSGPWAEMASPGLPQSTLTAPCPAQLSPRWRACHHGLGSHTQPQPSCLLAFPALTPPALLHLPPSCVMSPVSSEGQAPPASIPRLAQVGASGSSPTLRGCGAPHTLCWQDPRRLSVCCLWAAATHAGRLAVRPRGGQGGHRR